MNTSKRPIKTAHQIIQNVHTKKTETITITII